MKATHLLGRTAARALVHSTPILLYLRFRSVSGLLKNRKNSMENTIWRVSRSARIVRRRDWCQQKATHLLGRTAARALPPSSPILFLKRLRVVKGLLKNREIEKIARTTRSGTYLGQYGSVRDETGASRKLLTCLVELPPEPCHPQPQAC